MTSRGTRRFWRLFAKLPEDIQRLAVKNYHLWSTDRSHPSLRFRQLEGTDDLFTIRIGDRYRALAVLESDEFTWIWIGPHAEYNRIVRQ